MSTTQTAPPTAQPRSLFGLRDTPGRLALVVFRGPLQLYRRGLGWLLGRTLVLLVHIGRKTGAPHETVAMVLADDRTSHEVVIASAWGPGADWMRNLNALPAREVRIGRESFTPEHRFLTDDEAVGVAREFRRRHPWRLRLMSTILGWGDLRDDDVLTAFASSHPFVALRPAQPTGDTKRLDN